ncbi:PAS domain-containing protein [Streptomyces profundus]|nr:PAS domain-containing protein [Streptomyces sp. MA3_2.13]
MLDGMDAALFALDTTGRVTHWNQRAEGLLGWTAEQAVGRAGLGGWLVREADEAEAVAGLLAVARPAADAGPDARQVRHLPFRRADGGRALMRVASTAIRDAAGRPVGVYCAFGEVLAQLDLERDLALSAALLGEAAWGVLLVDADLRVVAANGRAADALSAAPVGLLGEPLAEFLSGGFDELESALEHSLAGQPPRDPVELWVTLRDEGLAGPALFDDHRPGEQRRCLVSGFVRLGSTAGDDAAPLGVAWIFQDVTETRRAGQGAARQRFRDSQLSRASRAAADCPDPMEAAVLHLHYALAGFADHALLDTTSDAGGLTRIAESPGSFAGPNMARGLPIRYRAGHPALQAVDCGVPVRATGGVSRSAWAHDHRWPADVQHALCVPVRSRGRVLGALTFLRGEGRRPFDRLDAAYGEEVALRVGAALDLSHLLTTAR